MVQVARFLPMQWIKQNEWVIGVLVVLVVVSAWAEASVRLPTFAVAVPATPALAGLPPEALRGQVLGAVPADKALVLNIGLQINRQALAQAASAIYDPSSPRYGHYLTPPQIADEFGAPLATVKKVSNWLTSQGFQIISSSPLRTNLVVQATALQVSKAFSVLLQVRSLDGRTFFGPDQAPSLPSGIAPLVASVAGLNNYARIVHVPTQGLGAVNTLSPEEKQQPAVGDCTLYGVLGGVTRDKIASTYALDQMYKKGLKGEGMKVAVVELDEPYSRNDVANYAACNGEQLHLRNVQVDNPLPNGAGAGEAALDLEMIAGLAPEAEMLDYQSAQADNVGFLNALNKIAEDDQVQVVSVSYGAGEDQFDVPYMTQFDDTLELMAVEGMSVFISSGDCGAFTDGVFGQLVVSFPASAPWGIGVGGTTLEGSQETAWSQTNPDHARCQNAWGTGGGLSQNKNFSRPSWQTGTGVQNQFSNTQRQVPDVAAIADDISIYHENFWQPVGGTSAAAPIWAAGAALVDQALLKQGKPLLGGVPALYNLWNHPGKYHPFHDVTTGTNLFYKAATGWDYTTGLGTPNFVDISRILGVTL
jgi:kumamolisin